VPGRVGTSVVGREHRRLHQPQQPRRRQARRDLDQPVVDLRRLALTQRTGRGSDLAGHPHLERQLFSEEMPQAREPVPDVQGAGDQAASRSPPKGSSPCVGGVVGAPAWIAAERRQEVGLRLAGGRGARSYCPR
jgi:hypothetical protein